MSRGSGDGGAIPEGPGGASRRGGSCSTLTDPGGSMREWTQHEQHDSSAQLPSGPSRLQSSSHHSMLAPITPAGTSRTSASASIGMSRRMELV